MTKGCWKRKKRKRREYVSNWSWALGFVPLFRILEAFTAFESKWHNAATICDSSVPGRKFFSVIFTKYYGSWYMRKPHYMFVPSRREREYKFRYWPRKYMFKDIYCMHLQWGWQVAFWLMHTLSIPLCPLNTYCSLIAWFFRMYHFGITDKRTSSIS